MRRNALISGGCDEASASEGLSGLRRGFCNGNPAAPAFIRNAHYCLERQTLATQRFDASFEFLEPLSVLGVNPLHGLLVMLDRFCVKPEFRV